MVVDGLGWMVAFAKAVAWSRDGVAIRRYILRFFKKLNLAVISETILVLLDMNFIKSDSFTDVMQRRVIVYFLRLTAILKTASQCGSKTCFSLNLDFSIMPSTVRRS